MRELTTNETDMVSAGPTASSPLALADLCKGLTPALALPGILLGAGTCILSTDPLATVK